MLMQWYLKPSCLPISPYQHIRCSSFRAVSIAILHLALQESNHQAWGLEPRFIYAQTVWLWGLHTKVVAHFIAYHSLSTSRFLVILCFCTNGFVYSVVHRWTFNRGGWSLWTYVHYSIVLNCDDGAKPRWLRILLRGIANHPSMQTCGASLLWMSTR